MSFSNFFRLGLGGESGVSLLLSWSWSRLFRVVRSGVKGVKKGIVIQELERPPPSGCCRLAVIGGI